MKQSQGFPQITAPIVNQDNGQLNQIWYQFFVNLYNRTGGSGGGVNKITPISLTGNSPFSYTSKIEGNIWVNPGCYTAVTIIRGGVELNFGYITRGIFPIQIGDTIQFKYTNLPPTIYLI